MGLKVVLGMSGGVDSSLSAALLAEQGYDVEGLVVKVWRESGSDAFEQMQADIARVAEYLHIRYTVLDLAEEFRREVVDYFAAEYERGRTPNPCIMCNPKIKFRALAEYADRVGAPYIATGHYARVERDAPSGRALLYRSPADRKDQTYFLYSLPQEILCRTLMPLGGFDKRKAREMAADRDLPVAAKPDSQEICFLDDADYAAFLRRYTGRESAPGNFVDVRGNVIGRHTGIINYTVGQRKGLGTAFGRPMFVLSIDAACNTITLGEAGQEFSRELTARDMRYIPFEKLDRPMPVMAKARYGARPSGAVVEPLSDTAAKVIFEEPVRAITPGQAVVLYDGDLVIGGGIIE